MLRYVLGLSLLTASIIGIRFFSKNRISRKMQYALWILIPLYMCIAPVFAIDISLPAKEVIIQTQATEVIETLDNNANDVAAPVLNPSSNEVETTVPEIRPVGRLAVLRNISLIISGILAVLLIIHNLGFILYCRQKRQFIRCDSQYGLKVYMLTHPSAPFLLGNCIYLSEEVAAGDISEYAICHEYCHYKHFDHVWTLTRYIVLILNWFNPIIWLAFKLVEEDCELACDEAVIARLGEDKKIEYGKVLLKLLACEKANNRLLSISTTMKGRRSFMKERIKHIKAANKTSVVALIVVVSLAILMAGCSLIDINPESDIKAVPVSAEQIYSSDSTDIPDSSMQKNEPTVSLPEQEKPAVTASETESEVMEYWKPYGATLEDNQYIFDKYYVEPRSYYFDGHTMYFIYDVVNNPDENSVTVTSTDSNAETSYDVSNRSINNNESRIVMRAIINLDEYHETCEVIIGAKHSSTTYSFKLTIPTPTDASLEG